MAGIRIATAEDGHTYLHREDIIGMLRESGRGYLEHIPAHVAAGEFVEAALDKHADYILCELADFLEKGPADEAKG